MSPTFSPGYLAFFIENISFQRHVFWQGARQSTSKLSCIFSNLRNYIFLNKQRVINCVDICLQCTVGFLIHIVVLNVFRRNFNVIRNMICRCSVFKIKPQLIYRPSKIICLIYLKMMNTKFEKKWIS